MKSPTSNGFGSPTPLPSTSYVAPDAGQTDYFRPDATVAPTLPTEPDASIVPDRIQFSIRLRFNPIRDLTPERLAGYLDSFRLGFFRNAALAWDAMERRDSRLQTVAPKRKKSVARHGWEVLAIDDSPEAVAQKEFLENFYNHLTVMTALEPDEEGGFALLIRQMMDAVGKRYAVHEIVWQPQPDGNLTAKLIFCPLWWFEGTRGKLRFLLNEFAIYGQDMDEGGWMVTVGDGLMEACSVAYMFKHLPMRDLLSYCERFATPGVVGKTDAAINSPEWEAMEETVRNFVAGWGAVTNKENGLELIEAKANGEAPFMSIINLMDEEVTRMWRGADLGTSSKHDSNGASLQADETSILEVDDAVLISETLTRKLSKYALQWKFGPDAQPLAYIKIKVSEESATELDLKVMQFLLAAGYPISRQTASETFGIPPAKDGEDLLTAPAAPAQSNQDKVNDDDGDAEIANNKVGRVAPRASQALIDAGKKNLSIALNDDLSHVLDRLNSILQITDDSLFLKKLQDFAKDFPQFKQDIFRDPASVRALQPILGAALANGLATGNGTEFGNGDLPGHDFHGNQYAGGSSVSDVLSGKHSEAIYAPVEPQVADKIKAAIGKDVSAHRHFIDKDALIHINREHGVGNEKNPNQIPITRDDIAKIPDIVANPDKVENGGLSSRKLQTVKYSKRFPNGTTYYVEEEWKANKVLAAKTMWKVKNK